MDEAFMRRAVALGEQGRVTAPPNPWVGCVIVKNGTVIGEGFHKAAGEPHAEICALEKAAGQAAGATVYVTLEPCAHHGRTSPCVDALIKSRISRVVIGTIDPDKNVYGKGIAKLKQAGIEVDAGVAQEEIIRSLAPYLHHRKTGKAFCVVKAAISVDGKMAAPDGTSRWITSAEARADAHQLRAQSQAIIIGAGTAVADKPRLTVRDVKTLSKKQPLRVVFDPLGFLAPPSPLLDPSIAPTLIITTEKCRDQWTSFDVEVKAFPCSGADEVDLEQVMHYLGDRGIIQAMVEGGSKLISSFAKQGLIDRYVIYVGPYLIGNEGIPFFADTSCRTLTEATRLHLVKSMQIGDGIRLEYEYEKKAVAS